MDNLWEFADFILNEMDVAFGVSGESTRSPSPRVVEADIERVSVLKGRESAVRRSNGVLPRLHSSAIDRLSPGKHSASTLEATWHSPFREQDWFECTRILQKYLRAIESLKSQVRLLGFTPRPCEQEQSCQENTAGLIVVDCASIRTRNLLNRSLDESSINPNSGFRNCRRTMLRPAASAQENEQAKTCKFDSGNHYSGAAMRKESTHRSIVDTAPS